MPKLNFTYIERTILVYRRLHLPMNARAQNVFLRDVKRLSFRCQTLKFSRPNMKFLLLDTAQRKDVANQQERKFLRNTPEKEEEQLCMAEQLSLGSMASNT